MTSRNLAGQTARAAPRPPGPVQKGLLPPLAPSGPPAGERRIGHLRGSTEAASAQPPPCPAFFEGDDVLNPCGHRPRCANLVHVGPLIGWEDSCFSPTLQPGPAPF